MDDGHYPADPGTPQEYLQLIDESLKAVIDGVPCVCVNPTKGVWHRIDMAPLPVLQRIAVECVTARLKERQPSPPFVIPRERHVRNA